MPTELSETQTKLLIFTHEYISAKRRSPTIREICLALGVRSTNAVAEQVSRLRRRGFIAEIPRGVTRAIQLSDAGRMAIGAPCCPCTVCHCPCHLAARGPAGQPM